MDENAIKTLLGEFADAVAKDLSSYKRALERYSENQTAQHSKLKEMADMVNNHEMLLVEYRKVWTENFDNMSKLLNEQTRALEAMRTLILPSTVN